MVKGLSRLLIISWCVIIVLVGTFSRKNIFQVSNLDIYYFNTIRGNVDNPLLARLDYNKITFYLGRYLNNFFTGTDPNYFFFGGHPREVAGGNNDFKINYWLVFLFIFGVYDQLLDKEARILIVYLTTLAIVSFFSIDALWWLLLPFIYATVLYPIRFLWKK